MLTWDKLYLSFKENPRDVHTHPINRRLPKWFYAYSEGGSIFAVNARRKQPPSSIKVKRELKHDRFDEILEIYQRREKGDAVSKDAASITRHTSYWYGVIYAIEHNE